MSAEQEYKCVKCGFEWSLDSLSGIEFSGCPQCKWESQFKEALNKGILERRIYSTKDFEEDLKNPNARIYSF